MGNCNLNEHNQEFIDCCEWHLDIENLKYMLNKYPDIDICYNNNQAFRLLCGRGNLETVKWLYEISKKINIHAEDEDAIRTACRNKYYEVVRWLLEISKNDDEFDIHARDEEIFRNACLNGNLEIAKYIIEIANEIKSPIDIHVKDEVAIRSACRIGHIEIVKWLLENNEKINIHAKDEEAFKSLCKGGYLKTVKLLVDFASQNKYFDQKIDIRAKNEAFRNACGDNYIDIARWIFETGDIDIHANNEEAFRNACVNNNIEIAKWLIEISEERKTLSPLGIDPLSAKRIDPYGSLSPKGIDIHAENNYIFNKISRKKDFEKIMEWLFILYTEEELNKIDCYLSRRELDRRNSIQIDDSHFN